MARNRKRAKARSTRPPRPGGSPRGVAGTRANGRANVEPLSPEFEAEEIVERDEVETGGAAEADIAAGADDLADAPAPIETRPEEDEDEAGYAGNEAGYAEQEEDEDEAGYAGNEAGYAEQDEDDAGYAGDDADGEDADGEDGRGIAVGAGALPAGSRRRPTSKERKAATAEPGSAVAERRVSAPVRLAQFLQGSWRELQRVQWPDRRQVMQATGVVVGFVIVAGAFLGFADYLSTKLINFILK